MNETNRSLIKKQPRDVSIDIIKAICIIFMVAGHCGSPITKFIYLFHMALFFIASGYCYKSENSDSFLSLKKFTKRKFVTLWIPFVLWTGIFSVLHNFFIKINVYTDNPLLYKYVSGPYISTTDYWSWMDIIKNIIKSLFLLPQSTTQMGGAFWFIATLMELSLVYCMIDFLIKKIIKISNTIWIQTGVAIVFLALGYGCHLIEHSFVGVDRILSFYILFHGGYIIKNYKISAQERKEYVHIVLLLLSFVILLICNKLGAIALNENSYENPLFLLVASFAGWQFLYEMAHQIKKLSVLKDFLTCVGQNTLAIVILHFLSFKIVSYIGVLVYKDPLCLVAAYPILYSHGAWWIAYLCVGVLVPLALSLVWKKVNNQFMNTKRAST